MNYKPSPKGAWLRHVTHFNGMAEARAGKFCTQVGYIKSYQNNEKAHLKGRGYGHVTYLNS